MHAMPKEREREREGRRGGRQVVVVCSCRMEEAAGGARPAFGGIVLQCKMQDNGTMQCAWKVYNGHVWKETMFIESRGVWRRQVEEHGHGREIGKGHKKVGGRQAGKQVSHPYCHQPLSCQSLPLQEESKWPHQFCHLLCFS